MSTLLKDVANKFISLVTVLNYIKETFFCIEHIYDIEQQKMVEHFNFHVAGRTSVHTYISQMRPYLISLLSF